MQQNILRNNNVTRIFIQYVENGSKKKHDVKLRFMDTREAYFVAELIPNFSKPKRKIPATLWVYTSDGIYKTEVKLLDSTITMRDIMFTVTIPRTWDFIQLRRSSRKHVNLPLTIKFNDGYTISATTTDLALNGVSFNVYTDIPNIYRRLSCICTVELPRNLIINLPDSKLVTEARFLREIITDYNENEEHLYVFKFLSINAEQKNILTNFLIKLD